MRTFKKIKSYSYVYDLFATKLYLTSEICWQPD